MKYYRYIEVEKDVPFDFHKNISVGPLNLDIEFSWPYYIEYELNELILMAYSRMVSQGLEDGTQSYDYFEYWADVADYMTDHTFAQYKSDTTKVKVTNMLLLPDNEQEAWLNEQLTFFAELMNMVDFYDELLVWNITISYNGEQISNAGNLGGWQQFPDGSFSYRLFSPVKDRIRYKDLPYMYFYFEVDV